MSEDDASVPEREAPSHVRDVASPLVGRCDELVIIERLLARQAQPLAPVVVFRGGPGIGKSALLDWAAQCAAANGMQVLRAAGAEGESQLAFSGLHQLLHSLDDVVRQLPSKQRNVMERLFGAAEGPAHSPFLLSAAVLAVLVAAAARAPVLITIDDIQWLDPGSAETLIFVARRLVGHPIVAVAAVRDDVGRIPVRTAGLTVHDVTALNCHSARQLLTAKHPRLAPAVRQRILSEAAGNALARLGLATGLDDSQSSGREPLPPTLRLTDRLKELFADRVRRLPIATRRLLLLAALEQDAPLGTLLHALGGNADPKLLASAERGGLIHGDSHRVRFRHPLVRSAIVQMRTTAERRAAHRVLAEALADVPERHARHRAAAAIGPDEEVAQLLVRCARDVSRKGGAANAAALLEQAADLTPDPTTRARRLVEAADNTVRAGQLMAAVRLIEQARTVDRDPRSAALGTAVEGFALLNMQGEAEAAHGLTLRSIDEGILRGEVGFLATEEIPVLVFLTCFYLGRGDLWESSTSALECHGAQLSETALLHLESMADPARTAHFVHVRLRRLLARLPSDAEPWHFLRLAFIAPLVDAAADFRGVCREVLERESRTGGPIWQFTALACLVADEYTRGRWEEASALIEEGLELARDFELRLWAEQLHIKKACLEAARGQYLASQARTDATLAWALPLGLERVVAEARHARCLAALGQGEYEKAYAEAVALSPPGELLPYAGVAPWAVMDLVEAAVATGRVAEARAHAEMARSVGIGRISSRLDLLTSGAAALAAPASAAGHLYEQALTTPEADRWPFELARVRLAYGIWLLHHCGAQAAHPELAAASAAFERLGAVPWATRARAALGDPDQDRASPRPLLTAHERKVAELAATGLTNKEIGRRLCLSPRTVGSHLYKIFPKLGVSSRAGLRDALNRSA